MKLTFARAHAASPLQAQVQPAGRACTCGTGNGGRGRRGNGEVERASERASDAEGTRHAALGTGHWALGTQTGTEGRVFGPPWQQHQRAASGVRYAPPMSIDRAEMHSEVPVLCTNPHTHIHSLSERSPSRTHRPQSPQSLRGRVGQTVSGLGLRGSRTGNDGRCVYRSNHVSGGAWRPAMAGGDDRRRPARAVARADAE